MRRIVVLLSVVALLVVMLAMSAGASLAQDLPPESCPGVVTAQENVQAPPPLQKPPPGVPFDFVLKCEV